MKEYAVIFTLIGGFLIFTFGLFHVGRLYERQVWKKELPPQMESMCEECNQAGSWQSFERGLEQGKRIGLSECAYISPKEN